MPHRPRLDESGAFHHVMNRALARRTLFERRRDRRYFLALVARAVRRGEIEVYAYALLSTHFHLLLRSLRAELSETMARIERDYVRWFNRSRRRDGPLFRGRFVSRRLDNPWYLRAAAAYVEQNAVTAGLSDVPERFPWCSAAARARRRCPPWLIERPIVPTAERGRLAEAGACVERWLVQGADGRQGELPQALFGRNPARVLEWMRRKAALADGTTPWVPVATVKAIETAIAGEPAPADLDGGPWQRGPTALACIRAGALRQLGGLAWAEIGLQLATAVTTVREAAGRHDRRVRRDDRYAAWAAAITRRAVESCFDMESHWVAV